MYLINRELNRVSKIKEMTFSELGFKERENLQEWLANEPMIFGEKLLIIQKEFDGFSDTKERLDLLAMDTDGNLVIIENKLDDSGRDVTWQALKYASYCSSLAKEEIREIFQGYLNNMGNGELAEDLLCDFFMKDYDNIILNKGTSQRIILVAAKFRKEVTSTVLWLMNFNLRIQCFKVTPYQKDSDLIMDIEQIIPIKDTEDYVIKMAEKAQDDSITEVKMRNNEQIKSDFWTSLLKEMNTKSDLFRNVHSKKDSWVNTGAGISGVSYSYAVTKSNARVELYIDTGIKESNKKMYDYLFERKNEIENSFNAEMIWARLDNKDASRIYYYIDLSYLDKESWPELISSLNNGMIALFKTFSSHLANFKGK